MPYEFQLSLFIICFCLLFLLFFRNPKHLLCYAYAECKFQFIYPNKYLHTQINNRNKKKKTIRTLPCSTNQKNTSIYLQAKHVSCASSTERTSIRYIFARCSGPSTQILNSCRTARRERKHLPCYIVQTWTVRIGLVSIPVHV